MSSNLTEVREIRKFGCIAFVLFACLFALGLWEGRPLPMILFASLSFIGLCFILVPNRLKPIYHGWLKTAHFIGRVVTAIILTLAYYLVITPSALIKRLFGGAPIPIKPDKKASSYWLTRSEPVQPRERFLKRY